MWVTGLIVFLAHVIFVIEGKLPAKIINGIPASIEEYPHHVSLLYQNFYICSASLITTSHVLTVASCIFFQPGVYASNLQIVSGGTNDRLDPSHEFHNVNFLIFHQDYDQMNFWKNDICILKLDSRITFSGTQSRVPLPSILDTPMINQKITVIGWGNRNGPRRFFLDSSNTSAANSPHLSLSRYLNFIQMRIQSYETCLELFQQYGVVHDSQGCALSMTPRRAVSLGDGGGSLLGNSNKIIGIVSVLKNQQSPSIVFTQVYSFIHWIEDKIWKY